MIDAHAPRRRDLLAAIGYGTLIWILATGLILGLGPRLVPGAGSRLGALLMLALAAPALGLAKLAYSRYRRTRLDSTSMRMLFGAATSATGLLLDALVYTASAGRYPLLTEAQQGPIAAFLVFAYGAMIVAPQLMRRA